MTSGVASPVLVTAGGLTVDCVVGLDGRLGLNQMGGNAAYAAAGARLWVSPIGLIGRVPTPYPDSWLEALSARGVDVGGVARVDAGIDAPGWLIHQADGERRDHLYGAPALLADAGLPLDRLDAAQITRLERLLASQTPPERNYGAFRRANLNDPSQVPDRYLGARGLHLAPDQPAPQKALAALFRAGDALISLDSGSHGMAWPAATLREMIGLVDAFLPSQRELAAFFPDLPPAQALERLAGMTGAQLVAKLGPTGSLVWDRATGRAIQIPAVETTAIDPTGAGDAFCGGFLAGLALTSDPILAACQGAVSASFAIEGFGVDALLAADHAKAKTRLADLRGRIGAAP
ncbi:MAG: carbohydrate kinase family protein [Elsteraceae bacterium]